MCDIMCNPFATLKYWNDDLSIIQVTVKRHCCFKIEKLHYISHKVILAVQNRGAAESSYQPQQLSARLQVLPWFLRARYAFMFSSCQVLYLQAGLRPQRLKK